jgi:ribosomal protein S18 acetylase RimI-like enzyme
VNPITALKIRPATQADHDRLSQISRSHRAGQGFTHFMFSGEAAYSKGWIRVAVADGGDMDGDILGFTCVRHKVRQPKTMLYYIIVDTIYRKDTSPAVRVGQSLLDDLMRQSPHRIIELSCLKDNEPALKFYAKNGFVQMGESLKGKGWHLEKAW